MFSLFSRSRSHSRGRYPDPNRGGSYYQRGSFFGRFGSFSGSSGRGRAPYFLTRTRIPLRISQCLRLRQLLRSAPTVVRRFQQDPSFAYPVEQK